MNTGILDTLIEFFPFIQTWKCLFKHIFTKINYQGEIKEICINCFKFKTGGYFK